MSDQSAPKCSCTPAENDETSSGDSSSVSRCCVKQRNWSLLHTERFADVCFVVGSEPDTKKILAHKAILSIGSSVFETMFSKNWSSKSNEIKVTDVDPASFSSMLRFIYTDDIQLTADSVLKILYAAKKYAVVSLEDQCADFLKEQLCAENACLLLTQARLFDQPKLIHSCLEAIDENPEDAFKSDGFTSIDLAALRTILERDTLCIDEVDLFKVVVSWSVAECKRKNLPAITNNQKLVLEGAESLVRFPLMTQKEFSAEVVPCGLLSNHEVIEMFQYFSGTVKTLSNFVSTFRSSKDTFVVQRLTVCSGWNSYGRYDGIGFSFDRNVRLLGFGLYLHYDQPGPKIDISVKNQATGDVLYQNSAIHEKYKNDSNYVFKVFLEKSVRLTANTLYAVITKTQAQHCYYGDRGQTCVSMEDKKRGRTVKVTFQNIDYANAPGFSDKTDVIKGQIPEIIFSW